MGKQAFPCFNGVYSFTQHRKVHPIRTSWERRLENGQTKGKRMIREGTIYEGHMLQITWSAEPPPLPRAGHTGQWPTLVALSAIQTVR